MRVSTTLFLIQALITATGGAEAGSSEPDLRGAWQGETYFLKTGQQYTIKGHIFFTERDWTVLFFVLGDDQQPHRGSAEGGTYALDGDQLVFTHLYNLSTGEELPGLPASDLRMEAHESADGAAEPCRVEYDSERMQLFFPSGNSMTFRRGVRDQTTP